MNIILTKLILTNFKGIKSLEISFDQETNIYGANEAGKTTIADAWYWLLFGKDTSNRSDFNIKNTVDTDLNRADHQVEAILDIDGVATSLKKIYREKWVKERGEKIPSLKGNENLFYWNDVPVKESEYKIKIGKLIEENAFKLLTNPHQFNTIKWQDRRAILTSIAGDISDRDIAAGNPEMEKLIDTLQKERKELKEYRLQINASKKKLKDDLEQIAPRIDETTKAMPEEQDFTAIEKQIEAYQAELKEVESLMSNQSAALKKKNAEQAAIQNEIHFINTKISDLKYRLQSGLETDDRNSHAQIDQANHEIGQLWKTVSQSEADLSATLTSIAKYQKIRDDLRTKWENVNAEKFEFPEFEFNASETSCSHCGQPLPENDIETRKVQLQKQYDDRRSKEENEFRLSKEKRLSAIKQEGMDAKATQERLENNKTDIQEFLTKKKDQLSALEARLKTLEAEYQRPRPIEERLTEVLANNQEYRTLVEAVAQLEAKIVEPAPQDNSEFAMRKQELSTQILDLNRALAAKDQIEKGKKRIEELKLQQRTQAQQLADLEQIEFTIEEFEKAKVDELESRINGKFRHVAFKMFNRQVNGGLDPTCETMYKGVPFSDLNTAGKIWAGLDIIQTLQEHYGVKAPIFLDNRESTTRIPEMDCQIINLIVSPADKVLRLESAAVGEAV